MGKTRKGSRHRDPRVTKCVCGKPAYRNFDIARRAASRSPVPGRVYWCPYGGKYHMTSRDKSEYEQVVAEVGRTKWRKPRTPKQKHS